MQLFLTFTYDVDRNDLCQFHRLTLLQQAWLVYRGRDRKTSNDFFHALFVTSIYMCTIFVFRAKLCAQFTCIYIYFLQEHRCYDIICSIHCCLSRIAVCACACLTSKEKTRLSTQDEPVMTDMKNNVAPCLTPGCRLFVYFRVLKQGQNEARTVSRKCENINHGPVTDVNNQDIKQKKYNYHVL